MEESVYFLGTFTHAMDAQRRVAIPSEWRLKDRENRFYATPGRNGTVQLMPEWVFQDLAKKLRKVSFANAEAAAALAVLGANSRECRCDKSGRVQLPEGLLEYAGLKRGDMLVPEVALVGAVTTIQIHSTENWAKQNMSNERTLDMIQRIQETPEDLIK